MERPERPKQADTDFAMLEPRVKNISEATIRKKWKKLPSSKHTAAREVIRSSRDQSKARRERHKPDIATEDCVQEVAERLTDRLPRIPFPPATDEQHFDFEANLARISKLEDQLSANIHSMNLLRAQIAREEELLKQDEEEAALLEKNLRATEDNRRQQAKALHTVAKKLGWNQLSIDLLAIEHESKKEPSSSIEALFRDEDLGDTLVQLQNHLTSMQQNTSVMRAVRHSIVSASTNLTMYHLSRTQDAGLTVQSGRDPGRI